MIDFVHVRIIPQLFAVGKWCGVDKWREEENIIIYIYFYGNPKSPDTPPLARAINIIYIPIQKQLKYTKNNAI
jgi:hypothetical protein